MISGVFGLPGAGKSLFLAALADRALKGKSLKFGGQKFGAFKKYKYVYTNFPFKGAYRLDFDKLGKVDITDACILIDEIMMFCDSRNFQSFGDNLKFFFSQHRKDRIDIIYCSQAYDDVDKKIRNVTDKYYYICRWLPGITSVKPIKAFFRVSGDITSGYNYVHWTRYCYFFRRKYYKMIDTNYKVAKPKYEAYTPVPWSSKEKL